ncbi:MAG: terminase large subunit [Caldilinea sp. CFX5]|nr:terminase large subunit [Caldilinea sp. CFX5]
MSRIEQYVVDVLQERVPACRWVRLACERHQRDLEEGHKRGLRFDERAAEKAVGFFRFLRHSKGEWAGQPLTLEPWQQFLIGVIFGWKRADGLRRFRTAYVEVPRKNGKSTVASGVGLFLFDADGEPGAEVYTAATKRDQARITHSEATRMVKASPFLRKRIRVFKDNLHVEGTASKFEPLGRDADSMDGLNIHGAVVDELHAHKNRDVWDVLETATGARRQPLMLGITTAGFNRSSLCWELHEYTQKILNRVSEDDSFFGIIFTIDEEDDWRNPKVWAKANPNFGISVKPDDLERKVRKAQEMPSALNSFLRLHLNVWTQAETKWLDPEAWRACAGSVDENGLRGRRCYGGLDLSRTTDITALVWVFPPEIEGEPYQVLCRFWVPERAMRERSRKDGVNYESWVRQGLIEATPGEVIDYSYVYAQVDEDAQRFDVVEVAFDRWGAAQVYQTLEEQGLTMVQMGQGFASMSAPMKELEKLILARQLSHNANPVLTWMADNLVAREDPAGNIKPDKQASTERIDGMVALIMGLDRAVRHGGGKSIYEEQEMRFL